MNSRVFRQWRIGVRAIIRNRAVVILGVIPFLAVFGVLLFLFPVLDGRRGRVVVLVVPNPRVLARVRCDDSQMKCIVGGTFMISVEWVGHYDCLRRRAG